MNTVLVFFAISIAESSQLPVEWKNVQEVVITEKGLVKFSIPNSTLDASRPALEDLRIFDPLGNEVPYVIEQATSRPGKTVPAKQFKVSMETQSTSIIVETGIVQPVDALEFQTSYQSFIKSVQLEGSQDGEHWVTLIKGQPIFKQLDGTGQLQISFPAQNWKFLRATIDDSRTQAIAISGMMIHVVPEYIPVEELPIEIVERRETAEQTRFVLNLNAANLRLAAIQIETPEMIFKRKLTVAVQQISENEILEKNIASGNIERVSTEQTSMPATFWLPADFRISSRKILLFIDNQQSPPLGITSIKVLKRPLYLTFVAKEAGAYSILSGNNVCEAPKYDLATIENVLSEAKLLVPEIRELHRNPTYRQPEALPEIVHVGPELDVSDWKFRKTIQTQAVGVQQLELDLQVLSRAQSSLHDLRLIHQGRQIPYVIEKTSISKWIAAQATEVDDPEKPSVTRWKLKLPHRSLPVIGLQCAPQAAIFRRNVIVYELVPDERGNEVQRNLGDAIWIQTPEQKQKTLTIALTSPTTETVFLEVDNADNPPLQIRDFQFFYNITRVVFKTSAGVKPFLYYGNSDVDAPSYDISLVASQLMATERSTAKLEAEQVLKAATLHEKYVGTRVSNTIFWIALIVVVVVLFFIISRLLPRTTSPS